VCTLALYREALAGIPLLVAANRDEFLARPSRDPAEFEELPGVVGGRDLVAGGSWLTLSRGGLVVGVLNRRTEVAPDPKLVSRGALCLELAATGSAADAADLLRAVPGRRHNPFNILVADRRAAFVAQNFPDGTNVRSLDAGTHVLTNLDLNDPTCPRIFRSSRRFAAIAADFDPGTGRASLVARLAEVLSDHQLPTDDRRPTDQLCIHTEAYGTRSSSILWLEEDGTQRYFHAAGPPCRTSHREVALPW
jgi:uncharacterized protein with NRDE domain